VEGERFDRRLAVYKRLPRGRRRAEDRLQVRRSFRTYLDVETVEDLPHSEHLVRVVEGDHRFSPRELSLDVRLAGGVRKEMVFALTMVVEGDGSGAGGDGGDDETAENGAVRDADVEWLSIGRLTP